MINNPIDILEHVLRLQNWSEQEETKEWGKEYANVPLIDVSTTEGGFDYEDLDPVKALRPARQILRYNDAYTDKIARSLCKQFFLCNYQKPSTGNESVAFIAQSGALMGSIKHLTGYEPMTNNAPPLTECEILQTTLPPAAIISSISCL